MKHLLFTTIHPAPYIDQWIIALRKKYDVQVFYNHAKSSKKKWQNYQPEQGIIIDRINVCKWLKYIRNADIIFLGGWNEPYNQYALIAGFFLRKEIAVFSDYPVEIPRYTFKWFLKKIFLTILVPKILCATESTKQYYQKTFGYKAEQTILFPYATTPSIDISKINQKRIIDINQGDKINFFIANNFQERKGYNTVLSALQALDKQLFNQIRLVIAGTGELFEHYSERIREVVPDVRILGWIENAEYIEKMTHSDVFIHASTFEPFGIPPIDAMKYGKLLIVSDGVKSTDGLIIDKINGLIFHAGNGRELADKINYVITHKNDIYKIGQKGKEKADYVYDNSFCKELKF